MGDTSVENQVEVMFWHTWLGASFDFFDDRRLRDMFAEFGIHPDTAFGCVQGMLLGLLHFHLHTRHGSDCLFWCPQVRHELPASAK
jgi:hypothetical protein